jgi:hypothetical protein
MTAKLKIAAGLSLPLEAVTQTIGVFGIRGSGKTNTAVVLAEELLQARQQVVIVDPVDVWWGLRSSKTGNTIGFQIPVIGGDHADLPLEAGAGSLIADFVVDQRASVVLSLRHLSMSDQRRFATEFTERLFARKGKAEFKTPLHLIVDEADEFVPQRIPPGGERMFGAFDRLVRRGRASGIGVTLISQRPQVVNKDVLSQIETLVAMHVTHKLDRKALEAWIEAHDTEDQRETFLASLASLGRGEAWIWSPAWLGIFQRVTIRERTTFDSSATPKAGEQIAPPKEIANVDLEKLRGQLAAIVEKAKADDPKELKRQIAELQKQLKAKAPPASDPRAAERVVQAATVARDKYWQATIRERDRQRDQQLAQLVKRMEKIGELAGVKVKLNTPPPAMNSHSDAQAAPLRKTAVPRTIPEKRADYARPDATAGKGERIVLTAIAQHEAGVTRQQLTVLTGYKRSTRDAYLQRLRSSGFVEQQGETIVATGSGVESLGSSFEPLPTGEELREFWLAKLSGGERELLAIIVDRYPSDVDRQELSDLAGYQRSSRDAFLQRLGARQLITADRGRVRASDQLFD